jgi:metacaspase-1
MAKRALLVGLNVYPDPANTLRGCLNDVRQMQRLLDDHFGFGDPADVRTLTDRRATTQGIKAGLAWLVDGARAGDVLVFHYSGHGSQVPDPHGDERTDGLDEIICPYDLDWEAPFTDDDLRTALSGVPGGVSLTVILDCCHAGTGLRDVQRWRCIPGPAASTAAASPLPAGRRIRRFGSTAARAGAVLIAACREDQVSADAFIDGDYHGALTFYLCRLLADAGYALSYTELVRRLRACLRVEGFDQVPQLEGPREAVGRPVFGAAIRELASAWD